MHTGQEPCLPLPLTIRSAFLFLLFNLPVYPSFYPSICMFFLSVSRVSSPLLFFNYDLEVNEANLKTLAAPLHIQLSFQCPSSVLKVVLRWTFWVGEEVLDIFRLASFKCFCLICCKKEVDGKRETDNPPPPMFPSCIIVCDAVRSPYIFFSANKTQDTLPFFLWLMLVQFDTFKQKAGNIGSTNYTNKRFSYLVIQFKSKNLFYYFSCQMYLPPQAVSSQQLAVRLSR